MNTQTFFRFISRQIGMLGLLLAFHASKCKQYEFVHETQQLRKCVCVLHIEPFYSWTCSTPRVRADSSSYLLIIEKSKLWSQTTTGSYKRSTYVYTTIRGSYKHRARATGQIKQMNTYTSRTYTPGIYLRTRIELQIIRAFGPSSCRGGGESADGDAKLGVRTNDNPDVATGAWVTSEDMCLIRGSVGALTLFLPIRRRV